MNQFEYIIDTYINKYTVYGNGIKSFECDYGELIFFKDINDSLILTGIYIVPEFRKKGLCTSILKYIVDKASNKFSNFCVQSVISNILYEYLGRFEYKGKKFVLDLNGFTYKLT